MLSALRIANKHLVVHRGWGRVETAVVGGLSRYIHIPHAFPHEAHGKCSE